MLNKVLCIMLCYTALLDKELANVLDTQTSNKATHYRNMTSSNAHTFTCTDQTVLLLDDKLVVRKF